MVTVPDADKDPVLVKKPGTLSQVVKSTYLLISCANQLALADVELFLAHKDIEKPRLARLGPPVINQSAIEHHCCESIDEIF